MWEEIPEGELDSEGVQGSDWFQDLLPNSRYTRLADQNYDKNTNTNENTNKIQVEISFRIYSIHYHTIHQRSAIKVMTVTKRQIH